MSNNNKWAGLSQREKAQLISIYTKHGYTNLSDITNHYNKFQEGGDKKKDYDVPFSTWLIGPQKPNDLSIDPTINIEFIDNNNKRPVRSDESIYDVGQALGLDFRQIYDQNQYNDYISELANNKVFGRYDASNTMYNSSKSEAYKDLILSNFYNDIYNNIPRSYLNDFPDDYNMLKINAPNTDISKFIYGNNISVNALQRIADVSTKKNIDPYDILAHMLIESSGEPITIDNYYNTHNAIQKQLTGIYNVDITNGTNANHIFLNMGLDPNKKYNWEVIEKAYNNYKDKYEKKLKEIEVPEDSIDAVAMMISRFGRDFNPAQKGFTWDNGSKVKNSYIDMIDSAIKSLKSYYPNMFTKREFEGMTF